MHFNSTILLKRTFLFLNKYTFLLLAVTFIAACKKEPTEQDTRMLGERGVKTQYVYGSAYKPEQNLASELEFCYRHFLEISWYNSLLPTIGKFDPRQYATGKGNEIADIASFLKAVKAYSKSLANGYDRFSFIEYNYKGGIFNIDETSGQDEKPNPDGYSYNYLDYGLILTEKKGVTYVAWVQRGIEAVNYLKRGDAVLEITNSNDHAIILKIVSKTSAAGFRTATIKQLHNWEKGVSEGAVSTINGKKVGYLLINSFMQELTREDLIDVFREFKNREVSELIIDLRYNTGGLSESVPMLLNFLIPEQIKDNTITGKRISNSTVTEGRSSLFHNQYSNYSVPTVYKSRREASAITPKNIAIIISGNTSSSSESFINDLKAFYPKDVLTVGKPTYGKVGGILEFPISDHINLWLWETLSINADGIPIPPGGIQPNMNAEDDLSGKLGSARENCFRRCLTIMDVLEDYIPEEGDGSEDIPEFTTK